MKHIILGTAHLKSTPGKRSPDGKLKEYQYSREICNIVYNVLKNMGYSVYIDIKDDDLKMTSNQELKHRVNIVNNLCKKLGTKDCIYVSIHLNAAGNGQSWLKAGGWSAYTSIGNTKSDQLAEYLYKAAKNNLQEYSKQMELLKKEGKYDSKQKYLRTDFSDNDSDIESNLYVLKNTLCPAVLTENLFQDNKSDVDFLLSEQGIHAISRIHIEGILNYIKDNS